MNPKASHQEFLGYRKWCSFVVRLFQLRLNWQDVIRWYLIMAIAGGIGTFLAYNGPLSSEAWKMWSGQEAWIRDILRVLACSLLALFMIWSLSILSSRSNRKEPAICEELQRHERRLFILFTVTLVLISPFLIQSFVDGLPAVATKRNLPVPPKTFAEIVLPYFPYSLYMFSLWLGLAFPVLILLLRRAVIDWSNLRELQLKLEASRPSDNIAPSETTTEAVQRLIAVFQDYVINLKNVGQRYFPILLAVSLILIYEQLTSTGKTVTPFAGDVGKIALWLLLGPSLIICVVFVALRYQNAARIVDEYLNSFIKLAVNHPEKGEPLETALDARSTLMWDHSPTAFVFSVMKGTSVSILFLVAVTSYVLKTIKADGWAAIFVPTAIVDLLKRIFLS